MKKHRLILLMNLLVLGLYGQTTYKGLPLIKAKSVKADYRIDDYWVRNDWSISPQIEFDSLFITCHLSNEYFAFYTDSDSIGFQLLPDQVHSFYVSLNDTAYALTVVKGLNPRYSYLKFDVKPKNDQFEFIYEQNNQNEYLKLLRSKYPIDSLVQNVKTDTEKALRIVHWVHHQWQHNGDNEPKKADAISILEEVKEGKNFRCVEYGIVTTACLNAVGLKARVLGLKTKDVETTKYGAGHVVCEVFLNDLHKWVMLDGQCDAMPMLGGVPLNAVEFQKAITEHYDELKISSLSNLSKRNYVDWIYPYLFYFNCAFDNTIGTTKNIVGKSNLMLVPLGEKNPSIFQIKSKIDYCLYTNSLNDFYAVPK